ncbi:MAG: oxidoreductase [Dictyoglomus sp. NZ13-RE01]|nr:MAG: oxidoreductase [Dictyoglomus sp. NZ13-RE01]
MKTVVVIGAGSRGYEAYGNYILKNPHKIKAIGVVEPDPIKRERFARAHNLDKNYVFSSIEEFFAKDRMADAVIISTPDMFHVEPAIKAIEKGYHILLEKPIAPDLDGVCKIYDAYKKGNSLIIVAHVLRYTSFFRKIKELLDKNYIGETIGINLVENVGFFHYAHSFVRGNWRNTDFSAPFILAKSCHDLDILYWLSSSKAKYITSFGELTHFKKEKAPKEAKERCIWGCMVENCPYDARRIYLRDYTGWPVSVITMDLSLEGRIKALEETNYGKCVYYSDNNVMDHQIANIVFENGKMATLTVTAFTNDITRKINIYGTHGEIYGNLINGEIRINIFGRYEEVVKVDVRDDHAGGDEGIMDSFVKMLETYELPTTTLEDSIESHAMAFSAEKSRINNGIPIAVEEFRKKILEG